MSDEPSAGAMGAAEAIWEAASVVPAHLRPQRPQLAAIIDWHTGLPELLAACEAIVRSAGYESGECEQSLRGAGGLRVDLVYLDAARAAIAKAKGHGNACRRGRDSGIKAG